MQSLWMLGVLAAGIGGFIVVAGWDSGNRAGRGTAAILAYLLIGAGVALFVAGIK
jgi:hypothetical protein